MRLAVALLACAVLGGEREVAITIDDLPRGGDGGGCEALSLVAMTRKLMKPFQEGRLPVTGFVNGSHCPDTQTLRIWLDAGAELGNHTFTHPNLNDTPVAEYLTDILLGEAVISGLTGVKPRYFRYPFLHTGADAESRIVVADYLQAHGYQNAPVTLDNNDYMFARVYFRALAKGDSRLARRVADEYLAYMESIFRFFEKRSIEVTGHEVRQTLLIHASQLNADEMPRLLAMMMRRGYRVVSLARALEDEAYQLDDRYVSRRGISWIHRWALTAGKAFATEEPDEPKWISDAWKAGITRRP